MALALFTDLYELTMMCAYLDNGRKERASFELFTRVLPEKRNYLIYAGLEDVVKYLEEFRFTKDDVDYLHSLKLFPDWFLDFLKEFKFTGNLYSMKEGTPFFPHEPVLRLEAPIYEAQLFETAILNMTHISTLVASKAARVYSVSRGKILSDFSLRRTHGKDAGMKAARSTYIAGFSSTSNVLAGKVYGIPVVGTVAHSFIMSFETEEKAFRAYLKTFPDRAVLLVDTYDTVKGVEKAIEVAKDLLKGGYTLKGVRLDSGDILTLSRLTREMLDKNGFRETKIIVSGGVDEYKVDELLSKGAPVDIFGVGTKVGTSSDSPFVDFVYKLVELGEKPVMKTSSGKKMYPGRKQVYRFDGFDKVTLFEEKSSGLPLLEPIFISGERVKKLPSLSEIKEYFLEEFTKLPEEIKNIYEKRIYRVEISDRLKALYEKTKEEIEEKEWM
ncbi:nicotinate phosphoribosyltransferase [Desulfurobacterium atlanticum]|uniref:Nicotinate phosphoribosyltransferase n=1 Tax=Desulfurobacterium atlanticum TaxID=240169 RepID=A0A238Z4P4_9BACT|nr:nicotinate phosphoribosyltransferase [Desulfurobacterium atlanticum]SNR78347.1 nicotinate phosphoribosyltransferase [Desulfurobacterium atlanticum]